MIIEQIIGNIFLKLLAILTQSFAITISERASINLAPLRSEFPFSMRLTLIIYFTNIAAFPLPFSINSNLIFFPSINVLYLPSSSSKLRQLRTSLQITTKTMIKKSFIHLYGTYSQIFITSWLAKMSSQILSAE